MPLRDVEVLEPLRSRLGRNGLERRFRSGRGNDAHADSDSRLIPCSGVKDGEGLCALDGGQTIGSREEPQMYVRLN
eukprot:3460727-Rhodomonas_salina.1